MVLSKAIDEFHGNKAGQKAFNAVRGMPFQQGTMTSWQSGLLAGSSSEFKGYHPFKSVVMLMRGGSFIMAE